ncbi:proline dehydrogenase family protein [candidate division KSB1 bacterium]|nr:proline dehydrogenase family protein [candidate division KSB1 bacterium]
MNPISEMIVRTLPLLPKKFVYFFARKYIAGPTLNDAIRVTKELNGNGMMTTIDVLGEFITTQAAAREAFEMCERVLKTIHDNQLNANLSVKPTSLGMGIDPTLGYQNISKLVELAARFISFVWLDMENSPYTGMTIELFQKLRQEFSGHIGIVLQAYLHRTQNDLNTLATEKLNIRLCKGIYQESADIAYKDREQIRENYKNLLNYALKNQVYVGIATHDDILIDYALQLIRQFGLSKDEYEFQMLLGVRQHKRDEIVAAGHRLRVYVPFGQDWYGYSLRRLKENPQMAWHITKSIISRQ